MKAKYTVIGLLLVVCACLAAGPGGCGSSGSPSACPHGAVTGSCLCGGVEVSSGYCCFGVPGPSACPQICPHGEVGSACQCGSSQVSDGYCCWGTPSASACPAGALISDHSAAAAFDDIPSADIGAAGAGLRIWYGHTSHGSQIVTGLEMLAAEKGAPWVFNQGAGGLSLQEVDGDLGYEGDLGWEQTTRDHLAAHAADVDMVMWSWCGGVSENTTAGIQTYLDAMDQLETDFPQITFVYMTGHTDAYSVENLRARNAQIRTWCGQHQKVLFDFEDVESWDPDGTYYPDTGDDCAWCSDWCSGHTCPACSECAHSHCFNCYQKGKAFWWLLARLSGWNG
jgi:hypothetical protein